MKKLSLILLLATAVMVSAETPLTNGRLVGTFKVQPTQTISALDINWSIAQTFKKTLASNSTFTFSNATDGRTIVVALTNTGSNYSVTFPAGVKWSGGTQPVQTIGSKVDVWTFVMVGSTTYGSVVQNFTP